MKRAHTITICLMISICLGCGTNFNLHVYQTSEAVSPTSYETYKGHMKRSVGRLRRLVLLTPRYTYIVNEKRKPEWEAKAGRVVREWVRQFLKNWRGYEIIDYDDSIIASTLGPKACRAGAEKIWQSLFEWADTEPIDAVPPENLIKLIKKVSEKNTTDGIIVIQGYQEQSSSWFRAGKVEIKADILESATGRLVWKSRLSRLSPGTPLEQQEVKALLAPVEFAVPYVLVK